MKKLQFRITLLLVLPALFVIGGLGNTVSLDTSFNGTGYNIQAAVPPPGESSGASMALQPDGKIVIAGRTVVNQSPDQAGGFNFNNN